VHQYARRAVLPIVCLLALPIAAGCSSSNQSYKDGVKAEQTKTNTPGPRSTSPCKRKLIEVGGSVVVVCQRAGDADPSSPGTEQTSPNTPGPRSTSPCKHTIIEVNGNLDVVCQ
jgi:hypothetical protein